MNNEPLITVITPMYNGEKSIRKTLDSIKNQSYVNFESLIIDDISTDSSVGIVKEYVDSDPRFKLISLPEKGGASIARNLGIEKALGKYIAFLDADDTWHQEKLEKQVKYMEENNHVFTYTNYEIVNENGEIKYSDSPPKLNYKLLLKQNQIGCLTVMYNREEIKNLKIPRLNKRNDYALWLKALREGHDAYLLDEILSTYYESSNSLSRSQGKFNLLKYHYEMFNKVLGYNKFVSFLFMIRNGLYNVVSK